MINLLSTRHNQYFTIGKITFENKQKKTFLCERLGITMNTLEVIIEDFNRLFSPIELESKNQIVTLKIPDYLSYDYFISRVFSTSLEYQILESIFFNNTFTYDQLAEKLFVSRSSLIRSIKFINEEILKFDFFIDTKPLKIVGNERNVRFFFITYFKDKYGLSSLPFDIDEMEAIKKFYQIGSNLKGLQQSVQDQNNFMLFCMVALYRERLGYKRKTNGADKNNTFLSNVLDVIENTPNFIKKKNNNFFDRNFLSQIFGIFLQEGFLKPNFFSKNRQLNLFKEVRVTKFIELISVELGLNIGTDDKFLLSQNIYEILFGYLSFPSEFDFLDDTYSNFYEYHSFPLPELKSKIKSIYFQCFGQEKGIYFPFVFFTTYTHWPFFLEQLQVNKATIKINVFIDFDPSFGEYIKSKIMTLFNGNYEVTVKNDPDNLPIVEETDLLITNVYSPINFPKEKIIGVSHFITDHDIELIIKKIDSIAKSK
ncbi:hypothetical protein IGI86_002616 [Enterococcus sp. AZ188]|uniref:helix-turn-helix domain-containing protein n=1 Tax=Enterococcus sp. AZ188 TaxID=2774678 RepID=UPI003D2F9E64